MTRVLGNSGFEKRFTEGGRLRTRLLGLSSFVLASPFSDRDMHWFRYVKDIGYDFFELAVEDPALLSARVVGEAARECGLEVSVCGAFGPGRDLSNEDPEKRRAGIRYVEALVDLAADVGSPHVAGPMYAPTGRARLLPPDVREEERGRSAESIREVAEYAGERGVRLAIEPLNRFETDLVNTVEQGLELCESIGRENVGLMLDTFHMNIEEKDIGRAIRRAGRSVFHIQASENDRGTPGSGHVPWRDVFHALDEIGYGGWVAVESFLPTVAEIARAVSLWRPVATSMDSLAREGYAFLRSM